MQTSRKWKPEDDKLAILIAKPCLRYLELLIGEMASRSPTVDEPLHQVEQDEQWQDNAPGAEPVSTAQIIDSYLVKKSDAGGSDGYLDVQRRKLSFFARQYPQLPTDDESICTYLRQFKTADVSTRQDQWKALSMLYKFALKERLIPVNPMLEVKKPRFKKKPGQRLSRDQAKKFISVVDTDLEWALVTCYFGLRLRRIEAERLLYGDIKSDFIVVRGKERTEELPLLPVFRDKLSKLANNHNPNDPLFSIKADTMAYHIGRLFQRAGIIDTRGSPHTLRNTAGRLWLTYGGDDRSNRQLLRHSPQTMTDHYSILSLDELMVMEQRFNPMLNLMRELELAPGPVPAPLAAASYQNTSSAQQCRCGVV